MCEFQDEREQRRTGYKAWTVRRLTTFGLAVATQLPIETRVAQLGLTFEGRGEFRHGKVVIFSSIAPRRHARGEVLGRNGDGYGVASKNKSLCPL